MALTQVTSIGLKDGEIVNADLHSAAAIVLSKLNTTGTASSSTFLRGDGAWTAISADGGNAATLDGLDSVEFLRSNTADNMSAKLTLNQDNDDQKLVLAGTNNPYIRWQEGTTNKAYIQWNASGYLEIVNQEDNSRIKLQDNLVFTNDGFSNTYKIWNESNDGSGSGLDADKLDGSEATKFFSSYDRTTTTGWEDNNRNFRVNTGTAGAAGIAMHDSAGTFQLQLYGASANSEYGFLTANWGSWDIRKVIGGALYVNSASQVWHQGNDGAGSGLDADTVDGYQTVTGNGNNKIPVTDSSGYLLIDDWIRVANSTGIYAAGGSHLFNGGASTWKAWINQSTNSSASGIGMRDSTGTDRGWAYADTAHVGLLNAGGSWLFKCPIGDQNNPKTGNGYTLWHSNNDGSGSGLDADSVDGLNASSFLRSDAGDSFTGGSLTISGNSDLRFSNGSWSGDTTKIQHHSNWLYLIGGSEGVIFRHTNGANRWQLNSSGHLFPSSNTTYDLGHSSYKVNNGYFNWLYSDAANRTSTKPTRFTASDDAWLRYYDGSYFRMWLGLSAKTGNYGRLDYTTDTNYWVGAATNGTVSLNDCMGKGNVFWDTWSNPNGQPSGTSHWNGFNCLHYTNRGTDGTSSGGAYGWQMTMGAGSPALTYLRGNWSSGNLGTPTWYKVWNESNDGSGSGLDADTVDGYEGSRLVINNSGNTVSGAPWELNNSGTSGWAFRFYNATGSNNYTYLNHGTHGPHIRNDSATNSGYLLEVYQSGASTFKVRGGDGLVTSGGNTMWHAGNDGSGSGLDADTCDGQHLGTSANVTFNNIYSNAWIRNNGNGEGLYNESSTQHFYSDHDDCWNVAGGSTSGLIRIRDENAGTIRGYVGANNSNAMGFLDYEGSWTLATGKFANYTYRDFVCSPDDGHDLGYSNRRFDNVYATNGTIQTSDRNEKENIVATDLGLAFVNKLSPVSFKRKGKTRTHYGFIAQDIEQIITDLGKTTTQFAPLIKSDISEAKDGSEYRYGLRYEQLLAPVVKAIQELAVKVAALESA